MAHAMCRVSLSTARQSDAQFAFVSHNPGHSDAQLYCHLFRARHARAVSVKMTEHLHCCYVYIPGTTCLHILLAHPGLLLFKSTVNCITFISLHILLLIFYYLYLYIYILLCYVSFFFLHCPLSGPVLITFHYCISCIIEYVTKKEP